MKSQSVKIFLLYYTCLMAGMPGEVSSSKPQQKLGRVVPGHEADMVPGDAEFAIAPQGELCAIWLRTARNSSVRHRCLTANSWPPPCLSASETKSYYAERIALERKKKGGGDNFCRGFYVVFLNIFLNPNWEPHYNLVISGGEGNQISKRNLTS